jgi:hypothetical protein
MTDIQIPQNRFFWFTVRVDLGLYDEIELLAKVIDLIDYFLSGSSGLPEI